MSLLALMAEKFELEEPPAATTNTSRSVDEHGADLDFSFLASNDVQQTHNKSVGIDKEEFIDDGGNNNVTSSSSINSGVTTAAVADQQETKLLITFLLMVIVGTANKVFQKLQAIPMYNYPNSLNLIQNFVYVPLCFAYILPVSKFGLLKNAIPQQVTKMSKKPFILMGFLDCITCMLLTFAAVYLPGSLLILLPQAAIPISMVLSKKIKGERYANYQYLGAVVVVLGILVVLEPLVTQRHTVSDFTCDAYDQDEFCSLCEEEMTEDGCLSHRTEGSSSWMIMGNANFSERSYSVHEPWDKISPRSLSLDQGNSSSETAATGHDHFGELCHWIPTISASQQSASESTTLLVWSIVTILACIPMCLSSIYKEMALSSGSEHQTTNDIDPIFLNGWVALFQLLFSFPLSIPAGMTSNPPVTPLDLPKNVWDGIKCYLGIATITSGCHPDDNCVDSPLYVNVFLVFNVMFNILIVYILKFGSANVLFMASTVTVPIGNIVFALPFMPGASPLKDSDIAGLMVILVGLVTYRFGNAFKCRVSNSWKSIPKMSWGRGKTWYRRDASGLLGWDIFAWDTPNLGDDDINGSSEDDGLCTPMPLLEEPLLSPVQ